MEPHAQYLNVEAMIIMGVVIISGKAPIRKEENVTV